MPDLEGILEVAREVSGIDWQVRDATLAQGDENTFTLMPVGRVDDPKDYVLLFIVGDPEEDVLLPTLCSFTMPEWADYIALVTEHTE